MSTLTIPKDRLFVELDAGDRIVAIDGHTLRRKLDVAIPRVGIGVTDIDAVALVNPLGTETEWHLYPDSQVEREITVERGEEPAAVAIEEPAPAPVVPPREPTAREVGTVRPLTPTTAVLNGKAHQATAGEVRAQDPAYVRKVLRNKSYVAALRALADKPNGYWNLGESFPMSPLPRGLYRDDPRVQAHTKAESARRGWGTTLGFMSNYGWCVQIGTAPARWQITQLGLDALLAYERDELALAANRIANIARAAHRGESIKGTRARIDKVLPLLASQPDLQRATDEAVGDRWKSLGDRSADLMAVHERIIALLDQS